MPFQSDHYQHDLDRASLVNLQAIKWFERLSKYLVADEIERDFYLLNVVDNIAMTTRDFPGPLEHLQRACDVLGLERRPALFLDTNPEPHSLCIGEREPMIVLSSGLLELLAEDELAAAIAHEVGHIACGHSYYKLLAENFAGVMQLANVVPGMGIAAFTVKLPLCDWYRKADLSADRAALLVMRDAEPVLRMIGKVAGGSGKLAARISVESLLDQAEEARRTIAEMQAGGIRDKAAYYFSNIVMQGMFRTQPWPAIRVIELQEWVERGAFQDLLEGRLPAAASLPEAGASPDVDEADQTTAGFFQGWTDVVTDVAASVKFWGAGGEESPPEDDASDV